MAPCTSVPSAPTAGGRRGKDSRFAPRTGPRPAPGSHGALDEPAVSGAGLFCSRIRKLSGSGTSSRSPDSTSCQEGSECGIPPTFRAQGQSGFGWGGVGAAPPPAVQRPPGAAGARQLRPALQRGELPPQPVAQHRLRLAGGQILRPGVRPRCAGGAGVLLQQDVHRLLEPAGQADQTAEGALFPLDGDAGHQLEGALLPGPAGAEEELPQVLRGDPGGHRAVGQGEHLALGLRLLLPAALLLKLGRPLAVGPLLGYCCSSSLA